MTFARFAYLFRRWFAPIAGGIIIASCVVGWLQADASIASLPMNIGKVEKMTPYGFRYMILQIEGRKWLMYKCPGSTTWEFTGPLE